MSELVKQLKTARHAGVPIGDDAVDADVIEGVPQKVERGVLDLIGGRNARIQSVRKLVTEHAHVVVGVVRQHVTDGVGDLVGVEVIRPPRSGLELQVEVFAE